MKNIPKLKVILLLMLLSFSKIYGQISIENSNIIKTTKFKKTYVVLTGITKPDAAEFRKIFNDYWKITTDIAFIEPAELRTNKQHEALYVRFSLDFMEVTSASAYANTEKVWYYSVVVSTYSAGKDVDKDPMDKLAKIIIDTDPKERSLTTEKLPYNGNGKFKNWQPGYIKNYLQQLSIAFTNPSDKKPDVDFSDPQALKVLKEKTLYVPDDITLKKYPFKTEAISNKNLSDKILSSDEPFYYVMKVRYGAIEYFAVVNSQTGEVLYQTALFANATIKNYGKKLADEIEK